MPRLLFNLSLWTGIGIGALAPIVWSLYWPAGGGLDVVGYYLGRDFFNVWSAPQVVDRHGVLMLFDLQGYRWAQADLVGHHTFFHNWGYPLHVLLAAVPFSMLPYFPSLIVWTLLGLALYLAAVLPQVAPEQRRIAVVFLLLSPAALANTLGGQNGFYTAALFLSAVALLDRRPWHAGVLLGLLTIKPHLGVLIAPMLVVAMAWRTIAAACATAALLVGASLVVYGSEPWILWLTETSAYQYRVLAEFKGFHSYMMTSVFASVRAFGQSPELAQMVQGVVSLGVIATSAVVFRKTTDVGLRALLLTSGTLLASPYVFNYDMTAITAAILWVVLARPSLPGPYLAALGAAWVMPGTVWVLHNMHMGLAPLGYGGAFAVAVALILREQGAVERARAAQPGLAGITGLP
ncbi:MAG TPA: glycosyltransferase family 87 protein [Xanthobacteraceae bacterium]|nr:glycosyltransferase family 87 protein [Xanthobacteraceae bacterium]